MWDLLLPHEGLVFLIVTHHLLVAHELVVVIHLTELECLAVHLKI